VLFLINLDNPEFMKKPVQKRKIEKRVKMQEPVFEDTKTTASKPLVKIASGLRPRVINAAALEAKLAPVPSHDKGWWKVSVIPRS